VSALLGLAACSSRGELDRAATTSSRSQALSAEDPNPCTCPAANTNTSRISFNDCPNENEPACSSVQCEYELCDKGGGENGGGSFCGCLYTHNDGTTAFTTNITEYGCLNPGNGVQATPYYGTGNLETHDCQ
jgi:hypothetical protein